MSKKPLIRWRRLLLTLGLFLTPVVSGAAPDDASDDGLFDASNLVAWCVVPFDASGRGPAERAEMLRRLGFKRLAYDWREQHVATFEEEILELKRHGIEYFSFWNRHPEAFRLFQEHGIHPQIWMTVPSSGGATQAERVAAAARQMMPMVQTTRELGCRLGLYNHGGWGGDPENLVAVCEFLRRETDATHVGIVYNFHHGHEHLDRFPGAFNAMVPHLVCVNLNGMRVGGPKILPIGQGTDDGKWLAMIRDSGYRGPIGILDHRSELDAEESLAQNLEGLASLRSTLAPPAAAAESAPTRSNPRVLVFSGTGWYRHPETPSLNGWLSRLGAEHGITMDFSETGRDLSERNLSRYDVVVLNNANSLDKVLDENQRRAFEAWYRGGGGIVGLHAALVRQEGWPWLTDLGGCDFNSDSEFLKARVVVDPGAAGHPAVRGRGPDFVYEADWTNHDRSVTGLPGLQVLLRVDESSYDPVRDYFKTRGGKPMGKDHPVAWIREWDGGRFFYTELGHDVRSVDTPFGRQHILEGIRWAGADE